MSAEVTPLRIESVSVKQSEDDIETASVSGVASIKVVFDREPFAFEKSEIRRYFEFINSTSPRLNDPSLIGKKLVFGTADPHAANLVVDHLRTQAANLAKRAQERWSEAAAMLSDLEEELQPPREEGDFRPNLSP